MTIAKLTTSRGFTLIEMIITMVLLGILATVGSNVVVSNIRSAQVVDSNQATANQARYVMERITRELREVQLDTSTSTYALTSGLTSNASSISFTRTIGTTDTVVTISRDSVTKDLTMQYVTPSATTTSVLASNTNAFTLNAYDIDGNGPTSASPPTNVSVRFVEVTLTLADPKNGQTTTERMRVALRNT